MAVKKNQRDSRLGRDESSVRKPREKQDREQTGNRELTDSERLDALRMSTFQVALPDLPPIDGYHVCWLTTTNPKDPVYGRVRMGYQLIKPEEIPGFEHVSLKSGEYAGYVGVNEMLAAKIPLHLYNEYMKELHYRQPLAEEEKLTEAVRAAQQQAALINAQALLTTEEGTAALGQDRTEPDFVTGEAG